MITNKSFSNMNLTLTGGLGVLGGLWLIVAPFVLNFSDVANAGGDNATLMSIIGGVIAIGLAGVCVATEKMEPFQMVRLVSGVGLVALGIWLMAAPYLFNYAKLKDPLWSLQITGGIFALVAGFVMQELFSRDGVKNLAIPLNEG